jgi:hypothetical protein
MVDLINVCIIFVKHFANFYANQCKARAGLEYSLVVSAKKR